MWCPAFATDTCEGGRQKGSSSRSRRVQARLGYRRSWQTRSRHFPATDPDLSSAYSIGHSNGLASTWRRTCRTEWAGSWRALVITGADHRGSLLVARVYGQKQHGRSGGIRAATEACTKFGPRPAIRPETGWRGHTTEPLNRQSVVCPGGLSAI